MKRDRYKFGPYQILIVEYDIDENILSKVYDTTAKTEQKVKKW